MAEAPAKDADSSQGKAKKAADSDDDHDDGKDKVVPQVRSRITENPTGFQQVKFCKLFIPWRKQDCMKGPWNSLHGKLSVAGRARSDFRGPG